MGSVLFVVHAVYKRDEEEVVSPLSTPIKRKEGI